ncbi:MAG: hypothetical protein A2X18_02580 [Bacteroidetes bacterium GWF2_40_14]|nr:MAG: hypothetical protein A2X18_02580 [Bacteroidetes bacterium GWF2_40_14]
MKEEKDYIKDITEIRSMMERSSKFLALSGWEGILAGIYALTGALVAYKVFNFNPDKLLYTIESGGTSAGFTNVIILAIAVLIMALGTAVLFSNMKAGKRGEKLWNLTTRRLLVNMSVPLVAGGLLILILISNGLIGLIAPCTLIFYGFALYNASMLTYKAVRILAFVEMGLGLAGAYFVEYGLLIWALGFGVVHIIYGIYMYYKYER